MLRTPYSEVPGDHDDDAVKPSICFSDYLSFNWSHSSVGQSVWLITIRSPVQAWMGPLLFRFPGRRSVRRGLGPEKNGPSLA